jgi:hypothetical protein
VGPLHNQSLTEMLGFFYIRCLLPSFNNQN